MESEKLPLHLTAQVNRLIERGMRVDDEAGCGRYLLEHNYFRLAGLWRYFQLDPDRGENAFVPETTFADIQRIQVMEDECRLALFALLLRFEMLFRAKFAFLVATSSVQGYDNVSSYRSHSRAGRRGWGPEELVAEIQSQIGYSKDRFIEDALTKRKEIPAWAAFEILSFGTLSKMYSLCKQDSIRIQLSKMFGYSSISEFATVAHSLSVLRNICAHGGRLWNRKLRVPPTVTPYAEYSNHSLRARIHHLERIGASHPQIFQTDLDRLKGALALAPEFNFGFERPSQ